MHVQFYPKKTKGGIKPFTMPFQKAGNFFLFHFHPSHLHLVSGEIHGSTVLGQQQHFHP